MQQRQPRLGDIVDDYCPRERRLTNHAVVAMIGDSIKQTRCTTCDSEHEFKEARLPRLRRKDEPAAGAIAAPAPRRVVHQPEPVPPPAPPVVMAATPEIAPAPSYAAIDRDDAGLPDEPMTDADEFSDSRAERPEEGPVHRRLIRAQLPKIEGQPAVTRQAPDFTIRQPGGGGRPGRFRGRPPQQQQRSGGPMFGNRSNSGGHGNVSRDSRGGQRPQGGRPPMNGRANKPHGSGRKRSK